MQQEESYQQRQAKKYYLKLLESKLLLIVGIPLVAFLITIFIFHFYRVEGISMERTFFNHDLLLVEKLGKTTSFLLHKDYVPKRYEAIVFKQPSYDSEGELVKRVIGVPGDRVVIKNKKVMVYNEKNPGGIMIDSNLPGESSIVEEKFDSGYVDVQVKKGQVFVLGDDRPNSDDSRLYGPVDTDNIVGKVIARILPFKNRLIL